MLDAHVAPAAAELFAWHEPDAPRRHALMAEHARQVHARKAYGSVGHGQHRFAHACLHVDALVRTQAVVAIGARLTADHARATFERKTERDAAIATGLDGQRHTVMDEHAASIGEDAIFGPRALDP